ncbi:MAG: hypothetical protein LUE14_07515 [Clostridiales bacterium]|nr:hypothetical protein [Clostridiales bacterium]
MQVYVIGLDMDNQSVEEIARGAAEKIVAITDELYRRQQEEDYDASSGIISAG